MQEQMGLNNTVIVKHIVNSGSSKLSWGRNINKRNKRTPLDKNVPKMVTVKELVELTGISEYNIRRLCKQNIITFIKSGRKVLINYDRFLDYLNGRE